MKTSAELLASADALFKQGMFAEAAEADHQALLMDPNNSDAHIHLGGILFWQGHFAEAAACYRQVLRIHPNSAEVHNNLGLALKAEGQLAAAVLSYRQALFLNPNYPDAYINLGLAYKAQGQLADAAECYRQALRIDPNQADAHYNLGNVLNQLGLLDDSQASYRQAIKLRPNHADAHINLGNVLKDQGRLDDALSCYQTARQLEPTKPGPHSNVLYCMLFHPRYDAPAIFTQHRRWEQEHDPSARRGSPDPAALGAGLLNPPPTAQRGTPDPAARLRLAYISPDFCDHVIGRNILPLLRLHDRRQFEVTLYANLSQPDQLTEQFRQCADHWFPIADLTDDQVAAKIRQDGIDILVDLSLHMAGNRLLVFARKPAPVQVTFAGYPGTTGLKAIDYRLTDPYLDPPGLFDNCYAETTIRLPHTFWCYDPHTEEPAPGPLPALTKGFITFGCLNNFCKINDEVLHLWARVLCAVDNSHLLLLAKEGSHRQRTLTFLARQGIAPERIEFGSPQPHSEYLSLYRQVDIGLDTFPYNGHTTSLDSLWMGVPVITLVGKTVVGRAGLSQLTNLGLAELAAETPESFVHVAVDLAGDLAKLQELRNGLRSRMRQSPLMDAAGFTRGIEEAYLGMWR